MTSPEAAATPWSSGRLDARPGPKRLLFGRMYEDAAVEARAFRPGGRCFCIASAGDTALALSHRTAVDAVDVNPLQLDYARRRAEGAPAEEGAAERLMSLARPLTALAGWRRGLLEEFLELDEPARQIEFWREKLDTRRLRWGLDAIFSGTALGAFYAAPLLASLPRRFGSVLRARMERCFSRHPNRSNPYARSLLLGDGGSGAAPGPARGTFPLRFACADAADYLEAAPAGSFDGFALSNILDGASGDYARRLMKAVRRASAPGALLVLRSFAEPAAAEPENLAAEDRSFLWGVVKVAAAGG